jgi:hypothetical protein
VIFNSSTPTAGGGGGGGGSHVSEINTIHFNSIQGAAGAASGGDTNTPGATGGAVSPTIAVNAGVTLYAGVGGKGGNGGDGGTASSLPSAGLNGGINGGTGNVPGGGGGGGVGTGSGGKGANGRVKVSYTYYNVTLTGVSPLSGPATGGTTITLTGTELDDATAVTVGGKTCTSLDKINSYTVECVTPSGTAGSTVAVAVTSHGLTVTKNTAFTYDRNVTLTDVLPDFGPIAGGTEITLTGTELDDATAVTVGGKTCTSLDKVDPNTVKCITPSGEAGKVAVAVTSYGITATKGNAFTYIDPAPTITGIDPPQGFTVGGETVEIGGTNFSADAVVEFDGIVAVCTVDSETKLICTTPEHAAGAIEVAVKTVEGRVAAGFTYVEPTIGLTLDNHDIQLGGAGTAIGDLWADHLTANVITDNPKGYRLVIESTEPRLTCAAGGESHFIQPLEGTGALDVAANVNRWGWAKDGGALATPVNWTGLTAIPVQVDAAGSATDPDIGRETVIWFGVRVDITQPKCDYAGSLTITAIGGEE